jgi:hypothetical protein
LAKEEATTKTAKAHAAKQNTTEASQEGKTFQKVNVLKIDKDCHVSRDWIKDYVRLVLIPVCKAYRVKVLSVQIRRSLSKGFHVYVLIDPPVDADLAIRLQFLAGDDALRVRLCRLRAKAGYPEWNKLWWHSRRRLRTVYDASWSCRTRKGLRR